VVNVRDDAKISDILHSGMYLKLRVAKVIDFWGLGLKGFHQRGL
jgi:hypothetical protein